MFSSTSRSDIAVLMGSICYRCFYKVLSIILKSCKKYLRVWGGVWVGYHRPWSELLKSKGHITLMKHLYKEHKNNHEPK